MMRLSVPLTMMLAACSTAPPANPVRQEPAVPAMQAAAQATTTPPATEVAAQAATTPPATQAAEQADAMATPMEPQAQADLITKVDAFLRPMVANGTFSGAVLLARDGEILLRRGYGLANREHDVPNTLETKFRISAMTMQFTAMAILMLQEQGKLTVSDRICRYVTDCPQGWQAITIHHLLTHTSGIPEFTDLPEYEAIKGLPSTPLQSMARFRDKPLLFEPGSTFMNGSSGSIVLSHIIAEVSGQSYPSFVREQILEPLDMRDTGFDTREVLKNRAAGYKDHGRLNADYVDRSNAEMYSTVEDLYRWDQALSTEQLLPKAALDPMFTQHVVLPEDNGMRGYGYGWELFEFEGRRGVTHLGGGDGFNSLISRFPDDKTAIIVLANLEWPSVRTDLIGDQLTRMIFAQP